MNKKPKYFVIGTIGILCFSLLLIFNLVIAPALDNPATSIGGDNGIDEDATGRANPLEEVHYIDLKIDFLYKPTKTYENFSLYEGETSVLDATEEKCDVDTKYFTGLGEMIIAIDGAYGSWVYTVNGVKPGVGAGAYYLSDHDDIEWTQLNEQVP